MVMRGPGKAGDGRSSATLTRCRVGVPFKADGIGKLPVGHTVDVLPGRLTVVVLPITGSGGQVGIEKVNGAGVVGLAVGPGGWGGEVMPSALLPLSLHAARVPGCDCDVHCVSFVPLSTRSFFAKVTTEDRRAPLTRLNVLRPAGRHTFRSAPIVLALNASMYRGPIKIARGLEKWTRCVAYFFARMGAGSSYG